MGPNPGVLTGPGRQALAPLTCQVLRGPVALAVPEDRLGEELLAVTREFSAGPLTLLPLDAKHGQALAGGEVARAAVAEAVREGVVELLQML